MVNLLIAKGAKIDSTTRDGLTPLHCAARSGHEQVIDILSENHANILSKTKVNRRQFHSNHSSNQLIFFFFPEWIGSLAHGCTR